MITDIVEHAHGELDKLGMTGMSKSDYITVIQAFADMTIPVSQEPAAAQLVADLLLRKNITPLSDDPAEWARLPDGGEATPDQEAMTGLWQSRRDPKMFSNDGGKTYFHIDEVKALVDQASRRVIRVSAHKT